MKILAIRGKNLASIEEAFEIDFRKEPLRSAGIFAITGNTGSGKSTLLDALCLALFDDTPRTYGASENISVEDVPGRTLNQRDCRTILRRGAGSGYAEADFVALSGIPYRSRWQVRRAHERPDGALQNTEIRLYNLDTGTEEQGTKTELLATVSRLIGLTFEQFTRAVLLAQGDFAAFLKARQIEKAELLEKLTGTEIYSRISVKIYEYFKEAETAYDILASKMEDVEFLSDEERRNLEEERETLTPVIEELTEFINIADSELKWMERDALLEEAERNARLQWEKAGEDVLQASSRYDYISKIDKVASIGERFYLWRNTNADMEDVKKAYAAKRKEAEEGKSVLDTLNIRIEEWKKESEKLRTDWKLLSPAIEKAKEIDIRIGEARRRTYELEADYKKALEAECEAERYGKEIGDRLEEGRKKYEKLGAWFKACAIYEPAVSNIGLITTLLEDIRFAVSQQEFYAENLKNALEIYEDGIKCLEAVEVEKKRVDAMLPEEIYLWRSKLEPGTPCPVCGSTCHPFAISGNMREGGEDGERRLREEELNGMKRKIAADMERFSTRVENCKNEISRLEVRIQHYREQEKTATERVDVFLYMVSDWKKRLSEGGLKERLEKFSERWKRNREEYVRMEEMLMKTEAEAEISDREFPKIREMRMERERLFRDEKQKEEELCRERAVLLNGNSVDEVTSDYEGRKALSEDKGRRLTEEFRLVSQNRDALEGTLLRMEEEKIRLSALTERLTEEIGKWLEAEGISWEVLFELAGKDKNWVLREKEALAALKENETVCKTAFSERRKSRELHAASRIGGKSEEYDIESLTSGLEESRKRLTEINRRKAEIEMIFSEERKKRKKVELMKERLAKNAEALEHWRRLNHLLGSASGAKFKQIAQGYTLDALLVFANKHLEELSSRYKLERIPSTLALQVVDGDMLNEVRTVHSLSGGESFLLSLALALGLSSLSSNRMKVESLFIDEGFGSLDKETLNVAMDVLEGLRSQGRKIGVISHVTEMTDRINAKIRVVKSAAGKSYVRVDSPVGE